MFIVKKSRLVLLLSLLIFLFFTNTASAEKQEWFDKAYDFSKVKRILVYEPLIADKLKNGINEHEILELFQAKMKLPNTVKVITFSDVVNAIMTDTGIDLYALYKEKPQEATKLLVESIPKYADISVSSKVFEYSMGTQYREGFTYNTTEYQTSYVSGYGGSATVTTPVTRTHTVPGGNVPVAYAAVRFEVQDLQSGKNIFIRLDDRAKANPTVFNNTKPKSLYGRITDSFFDDLSEKISKQK